MKKQKPNESFWFVLGLINLLAMVYPMGCYWNANSLEDRVVAVFVLIGVAVLLAIVDTVTIAVSYSG